MQSKIQDYFKFIKFSHTIFAMPFALIGFSLAFKEYNVTFSFILYIVLCMVFARNAAMGFNRYLDRKIDAQNTRTSQREIPAGKISPKNALIFVIINSILFSATCFFINKLVFYLSFVALFVVLGYSFTKRFTAFSHIVLGMGLSLAPIGAYLAISSKFDIIPLLFSFLVLFWVSGFDIIYAMQDYEFDKENNLNSIPVLLGKKKALFLSSFIHLLCLIPIIAVYFLYNFGLLYITGSLIFLILLFYQHKIVKYDDLSRVNLAFGTTNGIASVLFSAFVIADVFV